MYKTIDDYVGLALTTKENLLSLGYLSLSDEDVRDICNALKENPSVEELNLYHNNLTFHAAYSIASLILTPNSRIRKMDLSGNKLDQNGINAIQQAIIKSGKRIEVDFTDNIPSNQKKPKI